MRKVEISKQNSSPNPQDSISIPTSTSAYILCNGLGWFPNTPGGLNRYVYELVRHLGGDRIELCGIGLPDSLPEDFKIDKIELTNLGESTNPIWQRLRSIRQNFIAKHPNWQERKPDAINLHFALYSLPLLDLLPKDIPITFTFHGPWAAESAQEGDHKFSVLLKKLIEWQVYRHSDRFIVLSQAFGQILHQQYGIPERQIHTVSGGVDINRFQPDQSRQEARALLGFPQDRFILFTPRRLVQRMGVDRLLTALSQIGKHDSEVWLAIAGRGARRAELEAQAVELGLGDRVRFLGYLPDEQLPIAYQAADLTVIPSQALEGFGLVLLESLACGTPVMCTPVGGMPEVLNPFAPHLIARSAQAEDIAKCLEAVLQGSVALPSRAQCREYTTSNYSWSQIAPKVRQVLLEAK